MDEINLQNVLDGFNAPLSEEQAWAICYQCADFLLGKWNRGDNLASDASYSFSGLDSVYLGTDGAITKAVTG